VLLSASSAYTYLDELYRECSGTAHAYMNSGYKALLSARGQATVCCEHVWKIDFTLSKPII